eukprot:29281-Pelagococcus_subviridis.AAC.2
MRKLRFASRLAVDRSVFAFTLAFDRALALARRRARSRLVEVNRRVTLYLVAQRPRAHKVGLRLPARVRDDPGEHDAPARGLRRRVADVDALAVISRGAVAIVAIPLEHPFRQRGLHAYLRLLVLVVDEGRQELEVALQRRARSVAQRRGEPGDDEVTVRERRGRASGFFERPLIPVDARAPVASLRRLHRGHHRDGRILVVSTVVLGLHDDRPGRDAERGGPAPERVGDHAMMTHD